jgi:hypothetical protein
VIDVTFSFEEFNMRSLSIAVATVLFFSFQSVVFSQSNEIPPPPLSSVPTKQAIIHPIPEFAKPLVEPNVKDDPIKKLQREQLIDALQCVKSLEARFQTEDPGNRDYNLERLVGYVHNACAAAFNLAETDEKKIECLEYLIGTAKFVEREAEKSFNYGTARILAFKAAKFWRLDAEINLLKFRKDPKHFRFSFRSDN